MLHGTSCKLPINPLFSFTSEDNHPHLIVWSGIIRPVLIYSVCSSEVGFPPPIYSPDPWDPAGPAFSSARASSVVHPGTSSTDPCLCLCLSLQCSCFRYVHLASCKHSTEKPSLQPPTVSLAVVPRSRAVGLFCVCQWVGITSSSCLFIQ